MKPRFYVRDVSSDIRVVDGDYDHRDIAVFGTDTYIGLTFSARRRLAAIRCAELNAWHLEQMQDAA